MIFCIAYKSVTIIMLSPNIAFYWWWFSFVPPLPCCPHASMFFRWVYNNSSSCVSVALDKICSSVQWWGVTINTHTNTQAQMQAHTHKRTLYIYIYLLQYFNTFLFSVRSRQFYIKSIHVIFVLIHWTSVFLYWHKNKVLL